MGCALHWTRVIFTAGVSGAYLPNWRVPLDRAAQRCAPLRCRSYQKKRVAHDCWMARAVKVELKDAIIPVQDGCVRACVAARATHAI